jgi:hypothetical protein
MTAEQTLSDLRQMLTHIIDNMVTRDDYNLESLGFRIDRVAAWIAKAEKRLAAVEKPFRSTDAPEHSIDINAAKLRRSRRRRKNDSRSQNTVMLWPKLWPRRREVLLSAGRSGRF